MSSNFRRYAVAFVVGLLVGVLGASVFSRPEPKVEYRDRIVEVERSAEVTQQEVVAQVVEAVKTEEKVRVVAKKRTVEQPDGTRVTEEKVVVSRDTTVQEDRQVDLAAQQVQVRIEERVVEREVFVKIDPVLPQWRATAMVGLNVPAVTLQDGLGGLPRAAVYGAAVERRVVGPVWAGAWGTSAGTGGIALSWEF